MCVNCKNKETDVEEEVCRGKLLWPPKSRKETSSLLDALMVLKSHSLRFFFPLLTEVPCLQKTPQSRVNNPLSSIRNKVSKSGCKTDMLKASQFIYPAFKPRALSEREKWPIPLGIEWITGTHEGMINKKEGERTWAQWLWHR